MLLLLIDYLLWRGLLDFFFFWGGGGLIFLFAKSDLNECKWIMGPVPHIDVVNIWKENRSSLGKCLVEEVNRNTWLSSFRLNKRCRWLSSVHHSHPNWKRYTTAETAYQFQLDVELKNFCIIIDSLAFALDWCQAVIARLTRNTRTKLAETR